MSVESFRRPGGARLGYRYDDFTDPWEDAPTAVLCHGHPRNSNLWYEWVPLLSGRLRVAPGGGWRGTGSAVRVQAKYL